MEIFANRIFARDPPRGRVATGGTRASAFSTRSASARARSATALPRTRDRARDRLAHARGRDARVESIPAGAPHRAASRCADARDERGRTIAGTTRARHLVRWGIRDLDDDSRDRSFASIATRRAARDRRARCACTDRRVAVVGPARARRRRKHRSSDQSSA